MDRRDHRQQSNRRVGLSRPTEMLEPYEGKLSRTVVCPAKAGVFGGSQSHQGSNQSPCSLDGRS